jgi:hypothetical protein
MFIPAETSRFMSKLILKSILIILFLQSFANPVYSQDLNKQKLKEKIINAWLENSEKFNSFHFKYEQEMIHHKGMANYFARLAKGNDDVDLLPEKTTKAKQECEILANQNNIRYNTHGLYYSYDLDKIYEYKKTGFITKKVQYYFHDYGNDKPYPHANINKPRQHTFAMFPSLWFPIKLCTTPFLNDGYSEEFNIDPDMLKIINTLENSKGMINIEVPSMEKYATPILMTLDPKQKYMPINIYINFHDKNQLFHHTSYEWIISRWKIIDGCYLPDSWTWHHLAPDRTKIQTAICKSSLLEISKLIPETNFKPKIPVGTVVENSIQKINYVIQYNGTKRFYEKGTLSRSDDIFQTKIYKILMDPKYNHLKTLQDIEKMLKMQKAN